MLVSKVMKESVLGVLTFMTIFGCISAEICSVYNNQPISKYNSHLEPNFHAESYDLEQDGKLSLSIKIKFECRILVFNTGNFTQVSEILLENTENHQIYTTDDYSIDENSIFKISFAENIPQGSYNLTFNYSFERNSSTVFSKWLVLTNFDDNHADKNNSEAIRIWLRKSALGHGNYLMKNAERLLRAFKNVTGVPYNGNEFVKLDFFVVPKISESKHRRGDFIYVDEKIFVNEDNIATKNNEKLYRAIMETMVKDVFQNVKYYEPTNYTSFLLNLRDYMVYYITNKAITNWHLMDLFSINQRYGIFNQDFVFNRQNYDTAWNHFRSGGFFSRMIEHVIGEAKFNAGVKIFLEKSSRNESTLVFSDFIKIFGDRKEILEKFIESWVSKKGYPVVTIKRNYQENSAVISQSVFMRVKNKSSLKKYWVPLNFATQSDPNFENTTVTEWLDPQMESLEIVAPLQDKWLICNKQQFGFYRVNYDEKNWRMIIDYLKSGNHQKIHVLNRAQLIDDAFVLAEFGYLNFNIAFDLAKYLKVETEYVPWATFWEKMYRLVQYSSISSSRYYEPFKNMIFELSGPLERKFLSDESSDDNDRMKRLHKISFIKWTCFYGSPLCRKYSLTKLKNWLADPIKNPLLEDIRKEIICAGIRSADEQTWETLLNKYFADKDQNILYGLMCSSNYELLKKLILMFINGQLVQRNPWIFFVDIAQQSTIGLDSIIRLVNNRKDAMNNMNHFEDFDSPTGFMRNDGEITYHMNYFKDFVSSFCTVIEQFITNYQQFYTFKKILGENVKIIGNKEASAMYHFAQLKVDTSTSVLASMNAYWSAGTE